MSDINPLIQTTQVDVSKYVGMNQSNPKVWHEIYSTQPKFSEDLVNITASYYLKPDQSVSVTNSGINEFTGQRKTSVGTAKPVKCDNTMGYNCKDMSRFDVRFFFLQPEDRNKGNYWILDVVQDQSRDRYDYALVTNPSASMIWFLSSSKSMPQEIVDRFLQLLRKYRVDSTKLRKTWRS